MPVSRKTSPRGVSDSEVMHSLGKGTLRSLVGECLLSGFLSEPIFKIIVKTPWVGDLYPDDRN